MKKFWEKHDLFKVAGIMVIITVLMTWVIRQGYYQSELVVGEITRVGLFDFFTYGLLGMNFFTVLVTFIFVLGGFYQVLSKSGGYQKLTEVIAKKFKGKEILFVLLVSFKMAALSAIMTDYFVLLAFVPFIITIISKMKLDKITGFVTTFGSILIGTLGSIYSEKIVGGNLQYLGTEYGTNIWWKVGIFAIAFIVFNFFNILHVRKTLNSKKDEEISDIFIADEVTKKNNVWPVAFILCLFSLITVLAYLPWDKAFNVEFFVNATTWLTELKVLGSPIFAYLLGEVGAFGTWDLFGVQILMIISALLVKWSYKIKNEEFFSAFGQGFLKTGKLVIILLMSYLILEFAYMYPVIPLIADWIMTLSSKFNVLLGVATGLFTSLFTVEYQYTMNLIGSYLATGYSSIVDGISLMLQSTFGLALMITPASAILLVGLSYLDITYKDWFKYIWKFLLIMFIAIVVIMLIII